MADEMNPENPAFWDAWGELTDDWARLPAKERCVQAHATDVAYLSDMIPYFTGHPAESGDAWVGVLDANVVTPLIPSPDADWDEIAAA